MAHESTHAYVHAATARHAATHVALRELVRSTMRQTAQLQRAVAEERAAFGDMQSDETNPRVTALFVEANDLLKTVDRLAGELHALLVQFPPLIAREVGM